MGTALPGGRDGGRRGCGHPGAAARATAGAGRALASPPLGSAPRAASDRGRTGGGWTPPSARGAQSGGGADAASRSDAAGSSGTRAPRQGARPPRAPARVAGSAPRTRAGGDAAQPPRQRRGPVGNARKGGAGRGRGNGEATASAGRSATRRSSVTPTPQEQLRQPPPREANPSAGRGWCEHPAEGDAPLRKGTRGDLRAGSAGPGAGEAAATPRRQAAPRGRGEKLRLRAAAAPACRTAPRGVRGGRASSRTLRAAVRRESSAFGTPLLRRPCSHERRACGRSVAGRRPAESRTAACRGDSPPAAARAHGAHSSVHEKGVTETSNTKHSARGQRGRLAEMPRHVARHRSGCGCPRREAGRELQRAGPVNHRLSSAAVIRL